MRFSQSNQLSFTKPSDTISHCKHGLRIQPEVSNVLPPLAFIHLQNQPFNVDDSRAIGQQVV